MHLKVILYLLGLMRVARQLFGVLTLQQEETGNTTVKRVFSYAHSDISITITNISHCKKILSGVNITVI